MVNRQKNRGKYRLFAIICAAGLLLLGGTAAAAEKEPPPASPTATDIFEIPEGVGTEVWVDAAPVERENLPQVALGSFSAELLSPSTTIVINEFDQVDDDVEFYNLGASPVDMTNWQLKIYIGANTLANTYTFPSGFVLAPGGYVVLHESGNPLDNTTTDLYAGENLVIQSLGGAMSLTNDTAVGVDFVRWNVGMITPPAGSGWVGTNPYLPENVYFSLGRDANSLDQDYGEDWTLQVPTYGAQNDPSAPLCIEFSVFSSGGGSMPLYTPLQSAGCDVGFFVPGEVITLTADPDPGWEVGYWGETPATTYLGTNSVLNYTMTMDHLYLWLSYIQQSPAAGSVLLVGQPSDYSFTLSDLAVAHDIIIGHAFAPDWEVLHRYDLVIYQTFLGEPFYINSRAANYATYLDEGGCMWVEADAFDPDPDPYAPNVPYYYFGINAFGSTNLADTITGAGTLYLGLGPYDDPDDEYYAELDPFNGAEVAFKDISGNDIGVTKIASNYTTALISYNFNNLAQLDQAEILATFLDACSIPHTGFDFPDNDDFDTPFVIPSLNYTNTQGSLSIMQATTAGDDPEMESGNQYYHTVWYSYTPAEAETITVNTFGSDYDTVLAVWTGTRGSLVQVAVNDDVNFPDTLQSKVQFSADAGTTYYIEVASWSADYGTMILNVLGTGLLFEADFEEGDLLEWTRYNDGDGWLEVCTEGAMNGTWGACIYRGDNDKRKQLIDETPVDQTTFNARFNFDINSLAMGEGQRFRFVQTKMGAERPFFIVLKYQGGQYQIQLNTLLDDLTKAKTGWYVLTDAAHTIEIDWMAASGDGANDGFAALYIDDVLQETITGLDSDTLFVENFKVGFTSRLVGKVISGVFYVDDVATGNGAHIGLP